MISEKSRRSLVVLTLLVFGSFWLTRQGPEEERGPTPGLDLELDYALSDFEIQSFDLQGRPAYLLRAPRFTSDSRTGQGRIIDPQIEIHNEGFTWQLVAEAATVTRDRERVSLSGEVELYRHGTGPNDWLAMSSSEVTLEVTPRVAWSTQFVELMDSSSRLTATGFSVDMLNNQFRLQHDVKGNYAIQ